MNVSLYRLAVTLLLASVLAPAAAGPAGRQSLPGHVPAGVSRLAPKGRLPGDRRLDLVIGLPLRNRAGLTSLIDQLYDPASTNYHRYLTPAQFDQQFGPTEHDYQSVVAFAENHGLVVTGTHANRALLNLNASVADIEQAFQTTLWSYPHPVEPREFFAPNVEPSVEAGVPISDISGLNNYSLPHPKSLRRKPLSSLATAAPGPSAPRPKAGSGQNGLFLGNDFRAAYIPGVTLTGSGQTVGLLQFDGYYAADIATYESQAGLPNVPLQNVLLDGFNGVPTPGANSGNGEVALDIEVAVAMAPGLSRIIVYEAGPNGFPNDILNAMAANTAVRQFGCSWDFGSGPVTTTDQFFQRFAAQGQSFFDASGDSGAYSGAIPSPDDDPYITIVGGTALATAGPGGAWIGETVWNSSGGFSSSGGISTTYPIPSWQQGVSMSLNGGSTFRRNIPDVSIVADNIQIVADNGQVEVTGGTSVGAPLWAALVALANQQAAAKGRSPVGFINPAIYALGKGPASTACFTDITTGNNTNANPGQFLAVPGFDLCTGWGTPTGVSLLLALAGPDALSVSPGRGFVARGSAGGPFDISEQVFVITNAGTNTLGWSLGNLPAWLTASATGGTLAPGGTAATVTLQLTAAASSLPTGAYTADVWFTNVTSGTAQNRQFTVLAGQNLVQNGGFEVADFSWWDLVGNDAASYNFVDNGTSSSISPHSGAYLAVLGQSNSVAYLSQALPTRAGQPYLLSLWLSNPGGPNIPSQFLVEWDAASSSPDLLFQQQNPGALNWTNLHFVVTASGSTTVLAIGSQNNPAYFGLDDVSVTPLPVPQLRNLAQSGGRLSFGWNAAAGLVYQVQSCADLAQGQWSNLGNPITATSSTLTASDTINAGARRFYRVVLIP